MNRAGTPATMANGGTSCVTTAPAPTMAPRPMVTPGRIVALVPMSAHAHDADRLDLEVRIDDRDVGRQAGVSRAEHLRARTPAHVVLEDEVPRVHVRLRTDPDVIADDRSAIEAALDIGLRADEYTVAELERFEVLEPDMAANL